MKISAASLALLIGTSLSAAAFATNITDEAAIPTSSIASREVKSPVIKKMCQDDFVVSKDTNKEVKTIATEEMQTYARHFIQDCLGEKTPHNKVINYLHSLTTNERRASFICALNEASKQGPLILNRPIAFGDEIALLCVNVVPGMHQGIVQHINVHTLFYGNTAKDKTACENEIRRIAEHDYMTLNQLTSADVEATAMPKQFIVATKTEEIAYSEAARSRANVERNRMPLAEQYFRKFKEATYVLMADTENTNFDTESTNFNIKSDGLLSLARKVSLVGDHIETLGEYFLFGREGLTQLDLSPLGNVKTIGHFFLEDCSPSLRVTLTQAQKRMILINNYDLEVIYIITDAPKTSERSEEKYECLIS